MLSMPSTSGARLALSTALLGVLGACVVAFALRSGRPRADFAFTGGGEIRSLDPHGVTGVPEGRVIALLYEGLVARNPHTLATEPGAAESWNVSPDGRTYTFTLRADARWSNGDPLLAADFEWSFRRMLEPATACEYASSLWLIEGAREFTTGLAADGTPRERDWSRVGIVAVQERTLQIRLERPTPHFWPLLSSHVFAPVHRASLEALRERHPRDWATHWTRPGTLVTNGPFRLVERRVGEVLRFERNEQYWDARNVALRTVDVLSVESWSSALNLYLAGELDWVDGAIPSSLVPELLGREDFDPRPYLGVYFYRVNVTRAPLERREVRAALATALRRKEICELVLKAGQQPAFSFLPPQAGDYRSPKTFGESSDYAQKLLVDAGLTDAEGKCDLRELELHFNTSEVHRDIAEVAAEQWRAALGLKVRLRNQEWKSFLDAQGKLDYDLSRSSWIADYADPSSFLDIWTTGHENNRTGWSNRQYDELVAAARSERDAARRRELYANAERILMHELPCIPIYHYVSQNLVDPRVGGFGQNALNEQSPKYWYWRSDEELASVRAQSMRRCEPVESHGPSAGLYPPSRAEERR
ncbi:MAG: peptide ABC transporter substrate-binding protein [Planctomycetes bacterium]|nr:peptide ABC transporter substrate-binding protein [Planctomycetota bacterium]